MQIANREFSPRWWAIGLFVLVGGTMLMLGRWQLARAAEKISLMQDAEQASLAAPLALSSLTLPVADGSSGSLARQPVDRDAEAQQGASSEAFRRVTVQGKLLGDQQFLWDNRIHKGVAGFEVLLPVQLQEEGLPIALVNRGWVQPGASRSEFPDIALPNSLVSGAEVTIEGVHTLPSRGFAGGRALESAAPEETRIWPALLQYPDYFEISEALGHPVIMGVVQEAKVSNTNLQGLLYVNNWSPVANGPEKHYGYAFQWFAMFAALMVIFLVTNSRRIKA